MATRRSNSKNKILTGPPVFDKLAELRRRLASTDNPDHLAQIDIWEGRVRENLIKLSTEEIPGIKMLKDMAAKVIHEINQKLIEDPKNDLASLSEAGLKAWAIQQHLLFQKRDLWRAYLSFFGDAKREFDMIDKDLDFQLSDEESNPQPADE